MNFKTMLIGIAVILLIKVPALTGCGNILDDGEYNEFAQAIPTTEEVELRLPYDAVPNGLLVGETAKFYLETYDVTHEVNGSVYLILSVLEDVVTTRPAVVTDNEAVWGPYTPALEPTSFLLRVQRVAEGQYTYQLQMRPQLSTSESDWMDIVIGEAFPRENRRGWGSFELDCTSYNMLNPLIQLEGQMAVTYDNAIDTPRTIDVDFTDFIDLEEHPDDEPHSGTYRYLDREDGSGEFQFAVLANLHDASEDRPLDESYQVRSRWTATGAGRADVLVTGEEISQDLAELYGLEDEDVEIAECWDETFLRTFYNESPIQLTEDDGKSDEGLTDGPGQGDETLCPFPESLFADSDVSLL